MELQCLNYGILACTPLHLRSDILFGENVSKLVILLHNATINVMANYPHVSRNLARIEDLSITKIRAWNSIVKISLAAAHSLSEDLSSKQLQPPCDLRE